MSSAYVAEQQLIRLQRFALKTAIQLSRETGDNVILEAIETGELADTDLYDRPY